jgi:L-threonylcarbamoyladenylate synthase
MAYVAEGFDEEIIRLLVQGGVGLLPTDTVYGMSGRALDKAAVERLFELKGRDETKPFIILIPCIEILNKLSISAEQADIVKSYWPGPLSVIFQSSAPEYLTRGTGSLAVRLPGHPGLINLMRQTEPLVSTSANLQGQPPVSSVRQARVIFGNKLDFYVDAGELTSPPSTLVDIKGGKLKVVRQGMVKVKEAK